MKIIDCHTHFFPNKLFDALWRWFENNAWPIEYKHYADDLISILKKEGVTHCVSLHYPHKVDMANSLNEWTYQLSQRYSPFIIPFGSLHPDDVDKDKILKKCFDDYHFKGLKIHCHVQKVAPDDPRMDPIYETCEAQNKIILIHCGTGPHFKDTPAGGYGYDVDSVSGVKKFEKVLKRYPKLTFIVPHLGHQEIEGFINLLKGYPNLYLDTAMALGDYFHVEIKREWFVNNPDRILFGSDFPNIPHPWNHEKICLEKFKLGKEIENKIFYQNAASLLGIL